VPETGKTSHPPGAAERRAAENRGITLKSMNGLRGLPGWGIARIMEYAPDKN
jgi:hypothetical protein